MLEGRKLAQLSIVPVEANGIVDPKKIKKEIKENTVLVSVMYVNNEIGAIQQIKEIAKEIRHWKKSRSDFTRPDVTSGHPLLVKERAGERWIFPLFHTDAVQAANYLDLNVERLGVDLLSLSGTKIEGAGRVGALYKKKSVALAPLFSGGDQEWGLRPGTENLPEILKFSDALEAAQKIKEKESKRLAKLRDYFFSKLFHSNVLTNFRMTINGDLKNRLPNNVNITIENIPSDLLVIELSARGIMASSKSACKSSRAEESYVIKALRPGSDSQIGGVRFSLGRETTRPQVDYTVKSLEEILTKLKKWYT
jgi:cysteine desulfurase